MKTTIKQRVQFSEAEASYLVDVLRDHMRMVNNMGNWDNDKMDMNINIRMKLLKGITRIEDKKYEKQ